MGASLPAGGGEAVPPVALSWPDPLRTGCGAASSVVLVHWGWREAGPHHPTPCSWLVFSASGEGASRCHFTCEQRVLQRSHGAGRGSRRPEREWDTAASGARLERGSAGAASMVGPAVPNGLQDSTLALRAPPSRLGN